VGQLELKLCSETIFSVKVIVTLTFDLVTPKSTGLFSNMDNHSMKFEYCGPNGTLVTLQKLFLVSSVKLCSETIFSVKVIVTLT
jgi:hypothetical protein